MNLFFNSEIDIRKHTETTLNFGFICVISGQLSIAIVDDNRQYKLSIEKSVTTFPQ